MTAVEIAADVRAGRQRARDVVEESLAAIDAREAEIHAFNPVTYKHIRAHETPEHLVWRLLVV
jgi:Asp-tRNA(Asn)/Glu-tRNA(Gln) amidotransferase A subunit family amidase